MLEQAKRPDSSPKSANASGDSESLLRRPMDREVDPFGPKLEAPPTGPQSFSEDKAPTGAEAQAHEIGDAIAADLPRGLNLSHGALPSSVSEVAERHVGVPLGAPQMSLGGDGQRMAKQQGALAVAEGDTISVAAGELSTGTEYGRAVLGHELTHVAQQRVHERVVAQGMDGMGGAPSNPETSQGGAEGTSGTGASIPGTVELGNLTPKQVIDAIAEMLGPEKIRASKKRDEKPSRGISTPLEPKRPKTTNADDETLPHNQPHASREHIYGFGIAQAWASFGAELPRMAEEYLDLWNASKSETGMELIPRALELRGTFKTDVIALARQNLDKSETLAIGELEKLGNPQQSKEQGPAERSEDEKDSLQEVRVSASILSILKTAEEQLKGVNVYTAKASWTDDADAAVTLFNPDVEQPDMLSHSQELEMVEARDPVRPVGADSTSRAGSSSEPDLPDPGRELPKLGLPYVILSTASNTDKPASGSTVPQSIAPLEPSQSLASDTSESELSQGPVPDASEDHEGDKEPSFSTGQVLRAGSFNWSTIFTLWTRVERAKDQVGIASPVAFALSNQGQLEEFLSSDSDQKAGGVAKRALESSLKAMTDTRKAISEGTLQWDDFEQAQLLLLAGVPSASGVSWDKPVPEFAALGAIKYAAEQAATNMADEFQNVVALTTPVDATPAQRVAKARDALDAKGGPLETARTASLNPLLQNTTRGRAFLQNDFDEAVADFPVDTLAPGLRETLQAIRELYIDHVQGTKPDQTAKHWVAE